MVKRRPQRPLHSGRHCDLGFSKEELHIIPAFIAATFGSVVISDTGCDIRVDRHYSSISHFEGRGDTTASPVFFFLFFSAGWVPHTLETRGDCTLEQLRLRNATPCNKDRHNILPHRVLIHRYTKRESSAPIFIS